MVLFDAIELFLAELRRRGYSERTIRAYGFDLDKLGLFIKERSGQDSAATSLDSIDSDLLRLWVDRQLSQGNTPRTVARKVATMKSFFKFLYQEGRIQDNPTDKLVLPKTPKKAPKALSQEEIRQLISAPDPDEPNFLRDRAILILLYSTGLRVSELAGLKIEHSNLERQHLRIMGKGAKERVVPLQGAARKSLLQYLLHRENVLPKSVSPKDPLFVKPVKDGFIPMNVRRIQYLVEKYGKRAGLMTHVHPHLLRHSIATHLIEQGCNVEAVRQTLGHEDLATTSIYLKASSKYLKKEHEKYNPIDDLS